MNQYVADLLIISVFIIGWAISYGSYRFFFGLCDKRINRLENEIHSESPTPVIIREAANTDSHYFWGIHFIWIAQIIVFGIGVITDPTVVEDPFGLMINFGKIAAIPASITVFFAWLASTNYGLVVTIMNDKGVRQIRKGWTKFRPYGSLSWDEIGEVGMIHDIPRIVLTGHGSTLKVCVDCNNMNKLCKALSDTVPSERFDYDARSFCSSYA